MFFDQNPEEAFKRPKDGAVQHDGAAAGAIFRDIFGIQPLGQHEIHLQRTALPIPANRVAQHEFQLGAVKGALTRVQFIFNAGDAAGVFQRAFCLVPHRIRPRAPRRTV